MSHRVYIRNLGNERHDDGHYIWVHVRDDVWMSVSGLECVLESGKPSKWRDDASWPRWWEAVEW